MKRAVITLSILALMAVFASAQNYLGLLNDGKHLVSAGLNATPGLNANADYLLAFDSKDKHVKKYGLIAQANFPVFAQKGFDMDVRISAGALLALSGRFKSLAGLSWNLSKAEDLNGRYLYSGFKLDLMPGFYGSRWVLAPHVSLNYQPWIHIQHSSYAQQAFQDLYPANNGSFTAPADGWFIQHSLTLQTGLGLAYVQPSWHLALTAGFQHQPNRLGVVALPDIGILPFYGGMNVGYAVSSK